MTQARMLTGCAVSALLATCASQAMAASYTWKVITIPGATSLSTLWVNDSDQVVGTATTPSGQYTTEGFVWQKGSGVLVPTVLGLNCVSNNGLATGGIIELHSYAVYKIKTGAQKNYVVQTHEAGIVGINSSGTAVGAVQPRGDDGTILGASFLGRDYTLIPTANGTGYSPATAINDSGAIVGEYSEPGSADEVGYLFQSNTLTVIQVPGQAITNPLFIAADGTIAGTYGQSAPVSHAFILSGGTYTTVNVPNALATVPSGIGAKDELAGYFTLPNNVTHSFIFSGGTYYQIDAPGKYNTTVLAANAKGSLVGYYYDSSTSTTPVYFIARCAKGQICTQ